MSGKHFTEKLKDFGDMVNELMRENGYYDVVVQKIFSDKSIILEEIENHGLQDTEENRILDQNLKIDLSLNCRNKKGLKKKIYIQEHSRSQQAWKHDDITITGQNPNCGAEFEKTAAQYMVYVVTDAITDNGKIIKPPTQIIKLVVIILVLVDNAIFSGNINYETIGNFKSQHMFAVPISEIQKIDNALLLYTKAKRKVG
jgi:hypothetical protein